MRVLAGNIKEGDIIRIQTPDNFRGQAGRPTFAYVYAVNYDPTERDPTTGGERVASLSVRKPNSQRRKSPHPSPAGRRSRQTGQHRVRKLGHYF